MDLPFGGAISAYHDKDAPKAIREAIARADKDDILNPDYPYSEEMKKKAYEKELHALQIEINRALYMDEVVIKAHRGLPELVRRLDALITTLAGLGVADVRIL